jgi:hypothetical protein
VQHRRRLSCALYCNDGCVICCTMCQVVETYSEELGLGRSDSKHSHTIMSAHGPKKLAAVVAAVRTVQFMDRCEHGRCSFLCHPLS